MCFHQNVGLPSFSLNDGSCARGKHATLTSTWTQRLNVGRPYLVESDLVQHQRQVERNDGRVGCRHKKCKVCASKTHANLNFAWKIIHTVDLRSAGLRAAAPGSHDCNCSSFKIDCRHGAAEGRTSIGQCHLLGVAHGLGDPDAEGAGEVMQGAQRRCCMCKGPFCHCPAACVEAFCRPWTQLRHSMLSSSSLENGIRHRIPFVCGLSRHHTALVYTCPGTSCRQMAFS